MNKIKVDIRFGYKNPFLSVCLLGNNPNDRWDKVHNWVHHHLYCAALHAMRQKGAEVGKDPRIEKDARILSRFHGYGNWHGLEFKSEIHMSNFTLEFFQNVTPSENRNGGYYDFDKYKKFPYLLKIRLKVAIRTLIEVISPLCDATITFTDAPENSVEYLLKSYSESCHKNSVKTLEDVQASMHDYDLSQNNNDRDKKKIKCGELKYFYDYDGYLHRGIVYHNLNNMWWIIENDTEISNKASFELFDRTDEPIRKVLSTEKKIEKLKTERSRQIRAENFLRCNSIQKEINKLTSQLE